MKRVSTCLGYAMFGLAALALSACAGRPTQGLHTIGVFQFSTAAVLDQTREGFLAGMQAAGYEDGVNVRYDFKNAQGDLPTAQLIARELAGSDARMIVAISSPSLQAAIGEIDSKPIVFGAVANPYVVGAGESADDHLPNVTGAPSTPPTWQAVDRMVEVLPDAARVGVLWNPAIINSHAEIAQVRDAAAEAGLEVVELNVTASNEVLAAAQRIVAQDIDAIFVVYDYTVIEAFGAVVQVANDARVPIFTTFTDLVDQGATMAVGWDFVHNGRLVAELVTQVMDGADPATIPFLEEASTQLVVNQGAARAVGLSLPEALLAEAARVVG